MSNLSAFPYIAERSEGTPGLWNYPLSIISANIAALDSGLTSSSPSGNTFSFLTNIETSGGAHFQFLSVGSTPPSYVTSAAITVEVNSAYSDYLYFVDSSAQKSSYVIGSRAGNVADGLNIWDASAGTMIASFSKQSIRFFQNVVGPVFDLGGALTGTYNAATFGTGSQSTESRIQAAINQASIDGIPRVYVPSSMNPYSASSVSFIYTVQMVREGGPWEVLDAKAYGAAGTGGRDDTAALVSALSAAAPSAADGATGTVYVPTGTYVVNSPLRIPNKVRLIGTGRSSSIIRAGASFSANTHLVRLGRGTGIVFGSRVENLLIDCSGVTGSIGIYSSEANEQSGVFYAIVTGFRAYGVQFETTSCQHSLVDVAEIYSHAAGATAGIYYNNCGGTHSVRRTTTNGASGGTIGDGILISASGVDLLGIHGEQAVNVVRYTSQGYGSAVMVTGHSTTSNAVTLDPSAGQPTTCLAIYANGGTYSLTANDASTYTVDIAQFTWAGNARYPIRTNAIGAGLEVKNHTARNMVASDVVMRVQSGNAGDVGAALAVKHSGTGSKAALNVEAGMIAVPDGTIITPTFGYSSETSLGLYRSAASVLNVSYGTFTAAGLAFTNMAGSNASFAKIGINIGVANMPLNVHGKDGTTSNIVARLDGDTGGSFIQFTDNTSFNVGWGVETTTGDIGIYDGRFPGTAGTLRGKMIRGTGAWLIPDGSALAPSRAHSSESSLGFYRSGVSSIGLSYGALMYPDGSSTTPVVAFSSNTSLGFYSSGVQTIAQSYGTFDLTATIASIGSLRVKSGANNSCGTAVLGSNGSVNVANTYVKTGDLIFLTDQSPGGTLGDLELGGIRNSSGFTILSTSLTDTSTVAWLIIRPG